MQGFAQRSAIWVWRIWHRKLLDQLLQDLDLGNDVINLSRLVQLGHLTLGLEGIQGLLYGGNV